jgi:radical SAM protein with 4Fe4S-binding SPASM domain
MTIDCKFLDHALAIRPNGRVLPCCRYTGDEEILTDNSEYNKEFLFSRAKEPMKKGNWASGCEKCHIQESAGNTSMRTESLRLFNDLNIYNYQFIRGPRPNNPNIDGTLTFLEIMIGRYCNLKCRMCTPELSTSWDEDINRDNSLINEMFYNPSDWEEAKKLPKTVDTMLNLDKEACKDLNEIKITGGEPFLSDYLDEFLQHLVDWDLAQNITLDIFTNCTFIPKEKYIKNFNKFKMVFLNLSIDGIEERGEFIRKKSDWKAVSSNIKWYCDYALNNENIYVTIATTLVLYNVYYLIELINWIDNNIPDNILNGQNELNFLSTNKCFTPTHLSIYNLSVDKKKELINKLEKDFNYINKEVSQVKRSSKLEGGGQWSWNVYRIINQIKDDLSKGIDSRKGNKAKITSFNSFNKRESKLDRLRNENWQEIFPELKEFLND